MTIQNTPRRVGVTVENGSTTEFPFSFRVFTNTQVLVFSKDNPTDKTEEERLLKLGRDYEVRPNADQLTNPGGTVVLLNPLKEGARVAVVSDTVAEQTTRLTNYGHFLPEVLNEVHDRAVALVQEVKSDLERTVTIPRTSEQKPADFIKEFFQAHDEALDANAKAQEAKTKVENEAKEVKAVVDLARTTNKTTTTLLAQATKLKIDADKVTSALARENSRVEKIQSGVTALVEKANETERRLTKANSTTLQKLEELTKENQSLAQSVSESKDLVVSKTSEVTQLATQVSGELSTVQSLSKEVTDKHSAIDGMLSVVNAAKSYVGDTAASVGRMASSATQASEHIDATVGMFGELKREVEAKIASVDPKVTAANKAAETAESAKTEAAKALSSAQALDKRITQAQGEVDQAVAEAKSAAAGALAGQVQADWTDTDTHSKAYIRNKPASFKASWANLDGKPSVYGETYTGNIPWSQITGTPSIPDASGLVKSKGERGALAGYEIMHVESEFKHNTEITKNSSDTMSLVCRGATSLNFTPAQENECAVKVISLVALESDSSVKIFNARWAGGIPPKWGAKQGDTLIVIAHFIGQEVILGVFDNYNLGGS